MEPTPDFDLELAQRAYDLAWPPETAILPEAALAAEMVERGLRIAAGVRELALVKRVSVSIAVVDRSGELVAMDTMEGAPTGSSLVAQALAAASALYGIRSGEAVALVRDTAHLMPVPVGAVEGGMPLNWDGKTYAGIGVAGGTPAVCERILTSVMLSVA